MNKEFDLLRYNLGRLHDAELCERLTDPFGYQEMMLDVRGVNMAIDKETAVAVAVKDLMDALLFGAAEARLVLRPDILACLIEHASVVGILGKATR